MTQNNPLFDLTGRTALITGSSQGLGLALARGLGVAGAALVLNGRDETKLAGAAAALRAEGFKVATAAFDVTDGKAIEAAVGRVETEIAPIDILVNNAGIHRRAPLAEMTEQQWREVLDTNLTSAFLVTRQVAPRMIARKSGKIINTCSLMSEVCRPSTGNYAAAKGGRNAHARDGHRVGAAQSTGERHRAGLLRDRADKAVGGESGVQPMDLRAHTGGTLGPA